MYTSVRASQRTLIVSIIETSQSVLVLYIIHVCCESHTKYVSTFCGQNAALLILLQVVCIVTSRPEKVDLIECESIRAAVVHLSSTGGRVLRNLRGTSECLTFSSYDFVLHFS